ncbi:transcriptional regulator with XRE-family HTH domain [Microbacterium sp. SORGH_AS428]|uniref:helix-turn-helix domain-containing protein n=1 Tax=Microbacterium sp. SORGH_AS_0428 TaxID=3041788 RepID=UPI002860BEF7|nr:XRE family transcriptional regulator [Microbacterium sp. SORGH_AS_0428]MDR6200045.1 transcriptional regulator with XRE-family HTH domain [Microbacterium sp. SORGH_AS_0428]
MTDPVATIAADEDAAGQRLGARIRELRQARGLTLVRLAAATELSHPFLSQLERGLAQPSLASLRRIAVALETSPIELIAASDEPREAASAIEIQRAGSGAVPEGFASGTARMLAHDARAFHPVEVVADALVPGESFTHEEEEFLYVVAGGIRIELDGEAHDLTAGDSVHFPGGVVHRWWSLDEKPYRLLVVKSAGVLRPRTPGGTP